MSEKTSENIDRFDQKTPEGELSPEILENVMAKVRDIDKAGIAYTGVGTLGSMDRITLKELNSYGAEKLDTRNEIDALHDKVTKINYHNDLEKLRSMLEKGIFGVQSGNAALGINGGEEEENFKEFDAKKYREFLKRTRNNLVHFNITGRHNGYSWSPERDRSSWKGGIHELNKENAYTRQSSSVIILFNINDLKEVLPSHVEGISHALAKEKKTAKKFSAGKITELARPYGSHQDYKNNPEKYFRLPGEGFDEKKELVSPNLEYGFVASPRIKPKKFEGVVLSKLKSTQFHKFGKTKSGNIYYTEDEMSEIVKDVVGTMKDADKKDPSLLIPIYDSDGNLCWPQKMTYEEVKKFVEERDKNKKNDEGK